MENELKSLVESIPNNRLFAIIICLKHIIKGAKQWDEFIDRLEELIEKYKVVDVSTMGSD